VPKTKRDRASELIGELEQQFGLGEAGEEEERSLPPPQPGPQTAFLECIADIALYGGAAGGGKSYALLIDFARYIDNPRYGGVIFRRTCPQITNEGGLWDSAAELYPAIGAEPKEGNLEYEFSSGATVRFAHLQHEKTKLDWQGAQLARIGFDELCHFSETQFFYLLSRARTTIGVKPQVRATCNPDADSWVAKFIEWWIDQDEDSPTYGLPIPERSGVIRYFIRKNGVIHWADSVEELKAQFGERCKPKSFTFISSKVTDNKILLEKDPDYLANLEAQHAVERSRLLDGNWKVRNEAGKYINRGWFKMVPFAPQGGTECRFWDFAATEKKTKGDDPDWTVGAKMRRIGSDYFIVDVIRLRSNPGEVERSVLNTAALDGVGCAIGWEIEGGSSGKMVTADLIKKLAGYNARPERPIGDKLTRAKPFAVQAEAGNVYVVKAAWNEEFLSVLHNIPDGDHDDDLDAAGGAFRSLALPTREKPKAGSRSNW
jgi:predicted phage terminase large subunit-like protein